MIRPVEQINNYYSSLSNIKTETVNNIQIKNQAVQKAKARLYQSGTTPDPKILNLIHLAENSLQNGNTIIAENYADEALKFLNFESNENFDQRNIINDLKKENHNKKIQTSEKKEQVKHTYKDASNDAGVSFSYPSSLTGPQSFLAVPAHEAQHVGRRVSEAVLNGERIMVNVSYKIRYDPATGQPYMAGGTTRTIHLSKYEIPDSQIGQNVDVFS